jgi:hypothetical protein
VAAREKQQEAAERAAAWDLIERTVRALVASGDRGDVNVCASWQAGDTPFPKRLGRGWIVGQHTIHYSGSGPSGMNPGTGPSEEQFDVVITHDLRWLLASHKRAYVSRRRFGATAQGQERAIQDRLPELARELVALAQRRGVQTSAE